jgi:hypothetical protein
LLRLNASQWLILKLTYQGERQDILLALAKVGLKRKLYPAMKIFSSFLKSLQTQLLVAMLLEDVTLFLRPSS